MSQLYALIDTRKSGDAPLKPLGEVVQIRSGWGFPIADQGSPEGTYPFYKVSDMNLPGNQLRMTVANNYVSAETARRLGVTPAPAGTVIFPKIGAAVATNKKRLLTEDSAYDNNVMGLIPGDRLLPQYLLYWMQTIDLIRLSHDSGAVPSIRKSELEAVRIPLPSLKAQRAIVEVLDQFVCLTDNLTAEFERRTTQFNQLQHALTRPFNTGKTLKDGWSNAHLGEVCLVEKGKTALQKATPGTYPLVSTAQKRASSVSYQFDTEAVCVPLISSKGHGVASLSRIYYQSGKFALGSILCAVIPHDPKVLSAEFLWHFLQARKDSLLVPLMRGGANVSLTVSSLRAVDVQFPPIERQHEVVDALREIGALLTDEHGGIHAEIQARRKQFEYYRDKLLTF